MKPLQGFFAELALLILLTSHAPSVHSENILFFFGLSTYSHRIAAWPLVEALVERNHSVTFFQPEVNRNPHPNVIEINPTIEGFTNKLNLLQKRLHIKSGRSLMVELGSNLPQIATSLCEMFLTDSYVLQWIANSKFDLIYIDALYNECAYGIAYKVKAKTALFVTSHPFGWHPDDLGLPEETYWLPDSQISFPMPLSFTDRMWTTLVSLYYRTIRNRSYPQLEALLRDKLEIPDMPSIPDLIANTSLILTNTHFSEEEARSFPPNVVPIGGLICKSKEDLNPLPQNLEDFISAADSFVLVSFGSAVKIEEAPKELLQAFFKAMESVNIGFIWKWDGERPKGMPSNVFTSAWTPQQELLAHPKIKGFVTHGGLLSIHEAVCHQVPMISFPVFAEQDYNAERVQRKGRGILLEISSVTQDEIESALHAILNDDSYRTQMEETSIRFFDRPAKPIETAVWYTEYVLRHNDTTFMKPYAVTGLTWYQRRLLDVWGFLFVISAAFAFSFVKLLRCCARCACAVFFSSRQLDEIKVKRL